jgi:hypothetical protein
MKKLFLFGLLLIGLGMTGCEFNQLAEDEQVDEFLLVPKKSTTGQKEKTASNQQTSTYSCLISTLSDDEADYNYWNQAFWVHFPKPAVEQAEGKTIFKAFSFASEHAGLKAGSWAGKDKIVRVAQCEIPDSKLAETLLEDQLKKFGKGTWMESRNKKSKTPPKDNMQSKNKSGDWECGQWYTVYVCKYNAEDDYYYDCSEVGPICAYYVYVEGDDSGSGAGAGGGDNGFPSDDPGECDPTEPCFDDGGGGSGSPAVPPGVDPDYFNQLNAEEKRLCWLNPSQCYNVGQYAEWAISWAQQVETTGAHNGPQDALRHASWSGRITLEYNSNVAKKWTDAHEYSSSDPFETNMDQYNNAKGREIGSSVSSLQELIDKILEAYGNEELCTSLSDC